MSEVVHFSEEQHLHGGAHILSSVPRHEDGVAVVDDVLQGDGRARAKHQHHTITLLFKSLDFVYLLLRQLDAGAVALVKTFFLHGQFLALKLGVEASAVDQCLAVACTKDFVVAECFADGDSVLGCAVVVAQRHQAVPDIRPLETQKFVLFQRQHTVVFQQHH